MRIVGKECGMGGVGIGFGRSGLAGRRGCNAVFGGGGGRACFNIRRLISFWRSFHLDFELR